MTTTSNFAVRDDGDCYTLLIRTGQRDWLPVARTHNYRQLSVRLILACSEPDRENMRREVAGIIREQVNIVPAAGKGGVSVERKDGRIVSLCYGHNAAIRAIAAMIEASQDDISLLGEVVEAFLNATSLRAAMEENAKRIQEGVTQ